MQTADLEYTDPFKVVVRVRRTDPSRISIRAVDGSGSFDWARNDPAFAEITADDHMQQRAQGPRAIVASWPEHEIVMSKADFDACLAAQGTSPSESP